MTRHLLLCLALATTGCFGNFDAHLYQAREMDGGPADTGVSDAGPPDTGPSGPDAGTPTLALADSCMNDSAIPVIPRPASPTDVVSTAYLIDTTGFGNDISDVAVCTGATENGPDGFASITMMAHERWHFHLRRPSGGANAALYILAGCDDRTCTGSSGEDLCGDSSDEHFTFVPDTAGRYYLGVDSEVVGSGFMGELDVIHPVCGNHTREHSEGCDDGGIVDGDGCDSLCRAELMDGMAEIEANDDSYSANHVILGSTSGTTTILAHLAAACESDEFAFDVPAGHTAQITASIALTAGGCPVDATVPISLAVLGSDGSTVRATMTLGAAGGCPMVGGAGSTLAALAAGTYYVRIRSIGNAAPDRPVDYTLSIAAVFTP